MRSSPPIEVDCRPPRALARLWALWCLVLAALLIATAPGALAGGLCGGLLGSLWWLGKRSLAPSGPSAPVRLGWNAQGGWWLQRADGRRHYVQPAGRLAQPLGPWLLLVLRSGDQYFHLLLMRSRTEPRQFSALKSMLALRGLER